MRALQKSRTQFNSIRAFPLINLFRPSCVHSGLAASKPAYTIAFVGSPG